ncbi:hypothetical protein [Streptomyces tendae]|uniref:hypothetical protein n=1 Tax=Streptomyces tendae TaxID=1932 RepID=UPI0037177153
MSTHVGPLEALLDQALRCAVGDREVHDRRDQGARQYAAQQIDDRFVQPSVVQGLQPSPQVLPEGRAAQQQSPLQRGFGPLLVPLPGRLGVRRPALVGQFGVQGAHVRAYRVVVVAVHRLGAVAAGAGRPPEPEHLVDDAPLRVGEILEGGPRLVGGERLAGWELPGHVDLDVQLDTGALYDGGS